MADLLIVTHLGGTRRRALLGAGRWWRGVLCWSPNEYFSRWARIAHCTLLCALRDGPWPDKERYCPVCYFGTGIIVVS